MSGAHRPIIGLTPDLGETSARPGRPALPRYELKQAYCDAVYAAGGLPLVLPYIDDIESICSLISLCGGVVITGGAFDIPPEAYGEAPREKLGALKPARTQFERLLLREALRRAVPVLGVCGGMQLLAVELGATLIQDLRSEAPYALEHEQPGDSREPAHAVRVEEDSLLGRITGERELSVNTTHHQAVREPGRARVTARAPDGVIEAIELPGASFATPFVLGVQWHPELLLAGTRGARGQLALYRALVEAARSARKK